MSHIPTQESPAISSLLRHFPPPAILTDHSVGISVARDAVRFVELEKTKGRNRVKRFGTYPLPPNAIIRGAIEDKKSVLDVLTTIQKEHVFSSAHVSIPTEKGFVFSTFFDNKSAQDVSSYIEFTLGENVPMNPQDALFDYTVISGDSPNKPMTKQEIVVNVLERSIAEEYLELFTAAGIPLISLDIDINAVARAVVPGHMGEPVMVVSLGEESATIAIVHNRVVQFVVDVDFGVTTITNVLVEHAGMKVDEIEKWKETYGLVPKWSAGGAGIDKETYEVISQSAATLRQHIVKNILYWETQSREDGTVHEPVSGIIIVGAGARIRGMRDYLVVRQETPVSIANVWTNIYALDECLPPINLHESLVYAGAIGLSMRI